MDNKKLKELIKIFETSNISEFSYKSEEGEHSEEIHLSKNSSFAPVSYQQPVITQAPVAIQATSESKVEEKQVNNNSFLRSPLVGIYYSAPKPGEKPFVEVGKKVAVGDVICIIESMKIMNKVKADKAGIVKQVLLKDGMAVEFDEPLIEIE